MSKLIPLTGKHGMGKFAIVDDEDFEWLSKHKWYLSTLGYARSSRNRDEAKAKGISRGMYMHKEIMQPPAGFFVDHINRNKLDNQRANFRLCTGAENQKNIGKRGKNSKSIYKGIKFRDGRWIAFIKANGEEHHIGVYDDEQEAALAWDAGAIKYHGEFACLNFPDIPPRFDLLDKAKTHRNTSSQYRGVYRHRDKWAAMIRVNGKSKYLGQFEDEMAAARAYDSAAIQIHGSKAKLNFPNKHLSTL